MSPTRPTLTAAMEDYLKTIYRLQQNGENVSTNALAGARGVRAASVTGMIKKLAALELVVYEPYQGVHLTDTGRRAALETVRHHRLLELFLTETLGFDWDEVHEEAERLEHHISEEVEARLFELLGHPTHDPHGDPIPTLSGDMPALELTPLDQLEPGERGVVARVRTQDAQSLRTLSEGGLTLHLLLRRQEDRDGRLVFKSEPSGRQITLDPDLAALVEVVSVLDDEPLTAAP